MYGDKANLIPSSTTAVKLFLAKDFSNPEFADAVMEFGQSLNAYRVGGEELFTGAGTIASEDEAMQLAAEIHAELTRVCGADGEDAGLKPETRAKLKKLFMFLLTTVLPLVL